MTIQNNIESDIYKFLQHNITLSCDDKVVKSGKLILFQMNDYSLCFNVMNNKGNRRDIEIPYPFLYSFGKDTMSCSFDYDIKILTKNNKNIVNCYSKVISKFPESGYKYYNSKISLTLT